MSPLSINVEATPLEAAFRAFSLFGDLLLEFWACITLLFIISSEFLGIFYVSLGGNYSTCSLFKACGVIINNE